MLSWPKTTYRYIGALVVHDVRLYSVLDTVVISGDDVCCSLVFGTLVDVLCLVLYGQSC